MDSEDIKVMTARGNGDEEDDFTVKMSPHEATPVKKERYPTPNSDAAAEAKADRAASILKWLVVWEFVFMLVVLVSGILLTETHNIWDEELNRPLPNHEKAFWSFLVSIFCLLVSLCTCNGFQNSVGAVVLVFSLYLALGGLSLFAGFSALSELNSYSGPDAREYGIFYYYPIIFHILGGVCVTHGAQCGLFVGTIMFINRPVASASNVGI